MVGRNGKDVENVSDGVVNGIGVSVWSVEKNGVICPPLRLQNGGGAGRSDGVCPRRQNDVGKNDWADPPRGIENDVGGVSSHYFSASLLLLHCLYASSDDSFPSRGPSLDPSHEKTHPSTASPSQPLQLPQPSASAPASRSLLSLLEPPGQPELGL